MDSTYILRTKANIAAQNDRQPAQIKAQKHSYVQSNFMQAVYQNYIIKRNLPLYISENQRLSASRVAFCMGHR